MFGVVPNNYSLLGLNMSSQSAVAMVPDGQSEAGAETKHPPPPYTESDNCSEDQPLACYYPNCKYKATSWGKMFKHLINAKARGGHALGWVFLKGSYVHTMGNKELNLERNARRTTAKSAKDKTAEKAGTAEAKQYTKIRQC